MDRFIKVEFYPRHLVREGRVKDEELKTVSTYIRLDAFLEIDDLEPLVAYHDKWVGSKHTQTENKLQMSHCYLSRVAGLGINGITTDIYLTEDSYNKVLKALGITGEEVKMISINIGG